MGARTIALIVAGILAGMIGASVYGIISLPSDALVLSALVIPAGTVLSAILFAMLAVIVIVPSAKSYLLWRERGQS